MKNTYYFLLLLIPILSLFVACSGGPNNQGEVTNEVDSLEQAARNLDSIENVSADSWVRGQVYLPASRHSIGLVQVDHDDNYNIASWIPYSLPASSDPAILRDTIVYFKLSEINLGGGGSLLVADTLQRIQPANVLNARQVIQLIRGKSIFPHDLYPDHDHAGGQHVPGHIISKLQQARTIEVSWGTSSTEKQMEQYELVELEYSNRVKETVFVPSGWVAALSTSKNYYFDFYSPAAIPDNTNTYRKVLRSYSVEHSHPGHSVANVTLTPQ